MQSPYDPKDIVIKVIDEKEATCFASSIEELGIGYMCGLIRNLDETDAELAQRIKETREGVIE